MKKIILSLFVALLSFASFAQTKAKAKPKAKTSSAKTKVVKKEVAVEEAADNAVSEAMEATNAGSGEPIYLTEEIYTMLLPQMAKEIKTSDLKFESKKEEQLIRDLAKKCCACFEGKFDEMKKVINMEQYNELIMACFTPLEEDIVKIAKAMGKNEDDNAYGKSIGERVSYILIQDKCKPFLWATIQLGMNSGEAAAEAAE